MSNPSSALRRPAELEVLQTSEQVFPGAGGHTLPIGLLLDLVLFVPSSFLAGLGLTSPAGVWGWGGHGAYLL